MDRIYLLPMALAARVRQLWWSRSADRGDSPVPTAVIIAGLVVLAIAVVTWLYNVGDGFMNQAPENLPPPPGGGGGD